MFKLFKKICIAKFSKESLFRDGKPNYALFKREEDFLVWNLCSHGYNKCEVFFYPPLYRYSIRVKTEHNLKCQFDISFDDLKEMDDIDVVMKALFDEIECKITPPETISK